MDVGKSYAMDEETDQDSDQEQEADSAQLLEGLEEAIDQLVTLTGGLDSISSARLDISTPRIDSYRFSMANLEESPDVDLDAILGELTALETQFAGEIGREQAAKRASMDQQKQQQSSPGGQRSHSRSSSEGARPRIDTDRTPDTNHARTDSPDNDSAFSDTVSMLSSESSASSGGGAVTKPHSLPLGQVAQDRVKAEKIRMALEKMKEASVKKLFIKAFTIDGSTKSLLVDEKMAVGYVTKLLADKNHVQMDPKWAIVEHLTDLHMERIYEDHELLVENLMLWTRDSKNKIFFLERLDKTQLFTSPEGFLLSQSDRSGSVQEYDEHSRNLLLEEFFASTSNSIPEVEGPLYLKSDSKKGWKKYHFVLRASGLYYFPKEKSKTPRDLVCLATFDVNQVYYGLGWKKKYKAPTDHCFAIKHPRLQEPKSTKYIKFLCAEDPSALEKWMTGIRIAKHGRQLMENYRLLLDELAQEDLDLLAHARSCSVSSIAVPGFQSALSTPTQGLCTTPGDSGRHSRASSSSSSGCMSDGAPSSCENAFDSEFPMGTIKRKPSMKPSLPLTSITRQLKEVGENRDSENDASPVSCSSPVTYTNTGTLTRRHSRRKSNSTDDSSNSGTLKRQHHKSRNSIDSLSNRSGASTPLSGTPVRERASPFMDRKLGNPPSPVGSSPQPQSQPVVLNGFPSCMTDSITSLPPPPESSGELQEAESFSLPPPPPEMFRSTMSLDSLPPPPGPDELPSISSCDLTGSQLSLMSLPPLPGSPEEAVSSPKRTTIPDQIASSSTATSPDRTPTQPLSPDATPTHSRLNTPCFSPPPLSNGSNCSTPVQMNSPTCCSPTPNGHPQHQAVYGLSNGYGQPPPYINPPSYPRQSSTLPSAGPNCVFNGTNGLRSSLRQSLPRQVSVNSIASTNSSNSSNGSVYAAPPYLAELQAKASPQVQRKVVNFQEPMPVSPKKKKISFNLTPQEAPPIPKKPPPPKRSEKTKLSSPQKLANSNSAPPTDFLKDLQRVMKKKWQIAQKCKLEPTTTPHEVLGFRDPPPALPDYRETNVSNWVKEHYGVDNLYENVYRTANPEVVQEYDSSPVHLARCDSVRSKRPPPPPPPKRSETTHLTTTKLH